MYEEVDAGDRGVQRAGLSSVLNFGVISRRQIPEPMSLALLGIGLMRRRSA